MTASAQGDGRPAPAAGPLTGLPARGLASRWVRALRVQQWVKNLLVLAPVLAAHAWRDAAVVERALVGAAAFCLCASGAYLCNDILDAEADRLHPRKRARPIAAGEVSPRAAGVASVALLALGCAVAGSLGAAFLASAVVYVVTTTLYSIGLKRVALVDVFVLAALYTLRVIAGHLATGLRFSSWLLAFCTFAFLSLALVKRYAELRALQARGGGGDGPARRGYRPGDLEVVGVLGASSGQVSVLVLALYATSADVLVLYRNPLVLLLVCPVFLYWLSRFWLLAHRGEMDEDPILFAITDGQSYAVAALCAAIVACANLDLHVGGP